MEATACSGKAHNHEFDKRQNLKTETPRREFRNWFSITGSIAMEIRSPLRAVEDHHVDRPGVEAQQCVKLTGTNCSIGFRERHTYG